MQKLTAHDVRRLAVAAKRDPRTVRDWYADPDAVRPTSAAALAQAARRLGLPQPSLAQVGPARFGSISGQAVSGE